MDNVICIDAWPGQIFMSNKERLEEAQKKLNDILRGIGTWENKEEYDALKKELEFSTLCRLDHYVETAQLNVYREMYRNLGLPIPDDTYIYYTHVYPNLT